MKRVLQIEIDCGDTACASEPGKFCPFLGVKRFGTFHVCLLWREKDCQEQALYDNAEGWLQRCPQCLAAERGPTC